MYRQFWYITVSNTIVMAQRCNDSGRIIEISNFVLYISNYLWTGYEQNYEIRYFYT